jgi:hypothetical protein
MGSNDDNARLQAGTLPSDAFAGAVPFDGAATAPWSDPISLAQVTRPPPFPLEVLPAWVRDWAVAQSTALQCPVDLPACLALAVLALAAAKKFAVKVTESWFAPLNLYVVVGLGSGESKSPAFRAALAPVHHHMKNEKRRVAAEYARVEAQLKALRKQIDTAIKKASRQDDEEKQAELLKKADRLKRRWQSLQVEPAAELLTEDVTPEGVAQVLGKNDGRIGIFSDEGGPFALMGGRYSDKPNFEIYLKGHDGGHYIVHRKGSASIYIESTTITMGLAVQPHVVQSLGKESDFRGKGLLARYLYSMPDGRIGTRKGGMQADPGVQQTLFHAKVMRLLEIPIDRDEDRTPRVRLIPIEADAEPVFVAFRDRIESQLSPYARLGFMADWGSKIRGDVTRLAGLLHLADFLQGTITTAQVAIPASTMHRALVLADYFLAHTQIAFDLMGADQRLLDARHVSRWLAHNGKSLVSKRDIHQGVRGRQSLKTIDRLDEVLPLLVQHHMLRLRIEDETQGKPGRPAGPVYEVNPAVLAALTAGEPTPVAQTDSHPAQPGTSAEVLS